MSVVRDGLRELWVPPPGNLPALDGARSIAVLLVICDHFAYYWKVLDQPPLGITKLPMFYWGWTGVDLFFVLSGLLIGQQLWKEYQASSTVDLFRFVMKRGFRIWPLYFATLFALTCLPLALSPKWPDFVFLSNYIEIGGYIRGWSLSAEEQFYVLTPLVFLAMRRLGPRWIVGVLCAFLGSVLVSRWITSQSLLTQGFNTMQIKSAMYFPFHLHSEALFAGLLLAYTTVYCPGILGAVNERGFAQRVAFIGTCLAVLGILLRYFEGFVFNFFALALVYVCLIAWLLIDRSVLSAPFRLKVFYPISRLSFGMYLNHFMVPDTATFFISLARRVTSTEEAVFILGLLGCILQSVLIAVLTFVLVERPGLLARARFLEWHNLRTKEKRARGAKST